MKRSCANAQPRHGAICLALTFGFFGIIGVAFYWSMAAAM
jgi:hypothetical protein